MFYPKTHLKEAPIRGCLKEDASMGKRYRKMAKKANGRPSRPQTRLNPVSP